MIAVDTNVIVRLIVDDDPAQVARALALADTNIFYVSFTVVMEIEWVLRSRYCYRREDIVAALRSIGDLVRISFENDDDVHWAIDRYASGGELADYIHIAAAREIGCFASFEDRLARRAGERAPVQVIVP